jgi:hypothetical protein
MSVWRWQPARGTHIADDNEPYESGQVCVTLDEAYDVAESWWADGAGYVAIKLYVPTDLNPRLADSCDRRRGAGRWVLGRERWRENEAKAVKEGRA